MIDVSTGPPNHDLEQALLVLGQGGVVAFPTETYYGLAVDPFNSQAVARLFQVKRRPSTKPVLVLIDSLGQLPRLTLNTPCQFPPLMAAFWPGPLTLIFPAQLTIDPSLTAGTGTIGLRMSSHPLAHEFCFLAGGAITATSANRSGEPPARTEQEVVAQFNHEIDWVVKGGATRGGLASTIIAATTLGRGLRLVREGAIDFTEACLRLDPNK